MIEYIKSMRKYIGQERLLIVGASVFIHKDGKLLLQKRKDNGCWGDHGGCCELDELPRNISPPVKPALQRCVEVLRERGCRR